MTAASDLEEWITTNDGTSVNFGKTSYVAQITGSDPEYLLEREFINEKIDTSYSGKTGRYGVPRTKISEGEVYEVRYDSWNNEHRRYVRVDSVRPDGDGGVALETTRMDESDVLVAMGHPRGIEGIGSGTYERMRESGVETIGDLAELDDLTEIPGIGEKTAERIVREGVIHSV